MISCELFAMLGGRLQMVVFFPIERFIPGRVFTNGASLSSFANILGKGPMYVMSMKLNFRSVSFFLVFFYY